MEPRRLRLNRPTLGVCSDGPRKACVMVPANEIIEVELPDILECGHTIEVKWASRVLTMFTEDILKRGVAIDATTSGVGSSGDVPLSTKAVN